MELRSKDLRNIDLEKNCVYIVVDGYGISDEIYIGKLDNKLLCCDVNMNIIFEIKNIDNVLKDYDYKINGYEIINKNIEDIIDFDEYDLEF